MLFETNVIEVIQRTSDVKSVRFEKPQGFDYLAGQYVVLILGDSSTGMKKPFTLSSSPTENFLEITKKLTGHPFSNTFVELKPGDRVSINGPFGSFTFQQDFTDIGMLSGGIGITPLRSMIKYSIDKGINANIVLLYSNRSENDIPFLEELETAKKENSNIRIINTITRPGPSWKGISGRINAEMIKKYIPDYQKRTFFTCGPQMMVDVMVSLLNELEVPKEQIKREIFVGDY